MPRLLVVEDDVRHAGVTASGLRVEGFAVEVAQGAEAALDAMSREPFDAAVVDLMLAGTNGLQLARLARERHPDTRIVLTSAYHLSERQLMRVDCGAVGFVPKPYDVAELAVFLRAKLQGSESAPRSVRAPVAAA